MGRKFFRNSDIYNIVAANIKKERIAAGITQQELADRTGYSHEYIRRIEAPNRTSGFTIESVYVISKALCIPIEVLFETKKKKSTMIIDSFLFFFIC